MNWPLVAGLAASGLVTGWGLRGLVFRYGVPPGEPPRSDCPACRHPVPAARWLSRPPISRSGGLPRPPAPPADRLPRPPAPASGQLPWPTVPASGRLPWPTVPASGRCHACRARIGPPPLAVEMITALLFGALAARLHPGLVLAAACWLAACAVPLAWIDATVRRLPDSLTIPAYAGTGGLLLLAAAAGGRWADLLRAVLGGLALAAAYLAVTLVSRSGLGLGDVKLAPSLGTLLAWAGWSTLLAGTFAGFLLGAVYGAGLLLARRATRAQHIPFGPFMIAGTFLAFLASAPR